MPTLAVGQKFGELTVQEILPHEKAGNGKRKHPIVIVKCSCGTQYRRRSDTLTVAAQPRCRTHHRLAVGQQFGNWTVVGNAPERNVQKRGLSYLCCCNTCNEVSQIHRQSLVEGKSKGCKRCLEQRNSLLNKTIGKWTVLDRCRRRNLNKMTARYYARCECGHEGRYSSETLRKGNGCFKCSYTHRATHHRIEWQKWYFSQLVGSASKRNVCVEINSDDLLRTYCEQGSRCAMTGIPLNVDRFSAIPFTASLDRIDSSKGYIPSNVQWVHKDINRMKNDLPEGRFLELCRAVAAKHPIQN